MGARKSWVGSLAALVSGSPREGHQGSDRSVGRELFIDVGKRMAAWAGGSGMHCPGRVMMYVPHTVLYCKARTGLDWTLMTCED